MSSLSKKMSNTPTQAKQARAIRVEPTLLDPNMRNERGPAQMLLKTELGESDVEDADRDAIFHSPVKTKEEENSSDSSEGYSTMVIIGCVLVVIILIALIVYMVLKQTNDKQDEEEMRKMIQPMQQPTPHPRNNMPAMNQQQRPVSREEIAAYEEHQRNLDIMNKQQEEMRKQQEELSNQMQQQVPIGASFADFAAKDKAQKEQTDLKPKKEKPGKYSLDNPHPSIIRPKSNNSSEIDDILAKTDEILSKPKSKKSKSNKKIKFADDNEMSELDKALLDKVQNAVESDVEPEDE
jgi:flagellar basal body-associated protein FliL